MKALFVGVSVSAAVVLSGCTTDPLKAYPEAKTVRECTVLYEADQRQRRAAASATGSSGNFWADVMAGAVGSGAIESETRRRFEGCSARVQGHVTVQAANSAGPAIRSGGLLVDPGTVVVETTTVVREPAPVTTKRCANVLVGGAGYCVQ